VKNKRETSQAPFLNNEFLNSLKRLNFLNKYDFCQNCEEYLLNTFDRNKLLSVGHLREILEKLFVSRDSEEYKHFANFIHFVQEKAKEKITTINPSLLNNPALNIANSKEFNFIQVCQLYKESLYKEITDLLNLYFGNKFDDVKDEKKLAIFEILDLCFNVSKSEQNEKFTHITDIEFFEEYFQ
jgi:hypothetical protein